VTTQALVGGTGTIVSFDSPGAFVQGGIQLLGSPATRVTMPKKSFYEIGATYQVKNAGPTAADGLYTWITQNGTALGNTLTLSPVTTSNALVVRTFMVATTTASDYVQLVARPAAGTVGTLSLQPVTGGPVSGASATVTIREV
jgi:hypothetical protein